ncbi:MAG: phosphatidate cytidylyltransferase [Crocinitomicaceae bacterium]|nr:phosphatidate cytidylyltransferase [Crocinitomicaceae bacterium]
MNNLVIRCITGALFAASLLLPLFWNGTAATVAFGVFMTLGLLELYGLFKKNNSIQPSIIGWTISGLLIYLLFALTPFIPYFPSLPLTFVILFISFLSELWRQRVNPLMNLGIFSFGIFYLVVPFILLAQLAPITHGKFPIVVGLLLLIWTNDTFAYLTGSLVGKTKLIERVSPKKTWEGTIGGILFTFVVGALIGYTTDHILFWTVASLLISPSSIFGDLLESVFKRSLNIKDSGNILPGHGGILDRFDATLFAVPFFLLWHTAYLIYFITFDI